MKNGQTVFFAAEGAGGFPMDMLRYDGCYPATSEAAAAMATTSREPAPRRRVVLAKVYHTGWHPTAGRWKSFNWDCGRATSSQYEAENKELD